jgi:Ca2+-binding EF-hand superfamily protein
MFKFLVLPAMVAFSFGAAADSNSAQPTAQQAAQARAVQEPSFESLDRNGDHQISRTEAGVERHLSEDFAYIDTDGDGYISPAEYAARTRS